MSALRQTMIDQMLLKGYSERTKTCYLAAVSLLARHYHLSPDKLTQADIQNWLLFLVKERHLSPATCRLYLNAVRFLYLHVLHWTEFQIELITPKRKQRIPDLLSPTDVRLILENASHPKYRMMFMLCYACGLRVSELVALQVHHIHGEQRYLQVVQGKGFKDRNLPLSSSLLQQLREYWRGIHGLRHAYASHQLAAGMPLHQLKNLLGHTDLKSTERYLHWCPEKGSDDFDLLMHMMKG